MENVSTKKCFECDNPENVVEHHVVPRSKGGKRTIHLCQICHDKVHGIDPRNISISALCKAGIEKARKRGVKLGNPYLTKARLGAAKIIQKNKQEFYDLALPIISEIQSIGTNGLSDIAETLNARGIKSSRNSQWTATAVKRALTYKSIQALRQGIKSNQREANNHAEKILPIIRELQFSNITSLRNIADALNQRGLTSRTGKPFAAQTVKNILDRNRNKI